MQNNSQTQKNPYVLVVSRGCPSDKYIGNGIFEFDQAKALANAGCKVVFAAIDLRSIRRWRKWGIEHFNKSGVDVYTINIPLGRVPHCVFKISGEWGIRKLYRIIEREHGCPDVIHAHFLNIAEIALALRSSTTSKFVMTEHSFFLNSTYKNLPVWVKKNANNIYAAYDVVIAVSQMLSDNLRLHFDAVSTVVPNMVDPLFMKPTSEPSPRKDSFRFIFVGNLISGKSPIECISAFNKAFKKNAFYIRNKIPIVLDIIGGGPLLSECKSKVDDLNLSNHIKLWGNLPRTKIVEVFRRSDCFVLPSRLETFGVVYIEAMACGLPVIATKCGGPESFVSPDNGILIPVNDEMLLEQAMEYMLNHANEFDSHAIRKNALDKFSPAAISKRLIDIYQNTKENSYARHS